MSDMGQKVNTLRWVRETCAKLARTDGRPVVLFDLDATLFDNAPRTLSILCEFARFEGLFEIEKSFLELMSARVRIPYQIDQVLLSAGLSDEGIIDRAKSFWFERFFSDRYQLFDAPLQGARDFVQSLYDVGATIVYLSGRDVPGMLVGCVESLRQHGFPIAMPRAVLILKPAFEMDDLCFKKEAVEFVAELGNVIATFDNEPENCNLFYERFRSSTCVHLITHHKSNAPPLRMGVESISDFVIA